MEDTKGFYPKYIVKKSDGSPVNPNNKYIILRYDKDDEYGEVTRYLLLIFCRLIKPFAKKFSLELRDEMVEELSRIGQERKKVK